MKFIQEANFKKTATIIAQELGSFLVALAILIALSAINLSGFSFYQPSAKCPNTSGQYIATSVLQYWLWFKLAQIFAFYQLLLIIKNKKALFNALYVVTMVSAIFAFDFCSYSLWQGYQLWMFVLFFSFMILTLNIVKSFLIKLNKQGLGLLLLNGLMITLCYSITYIIIHIVNNRIYYALTANGSYSSQLAYFYLFPLIQIVVDLWIRICMKFAHAHIREFISQTYWLLYGFRVGVLSRIYYKQAQFYYILLFVAFKDLSLSWLIKMPFPLLRVHQPSFIINFWPVAYLLATFFNYNPVATILSTPILSSKCLLDYDWKRTYLVPVSNYVTYSGTNNFLSNNSQSIAVSIAGLIGWLPVRKYRLQPISWFHFIYLLFGLYLFLQGCTAGSRLQWWI